MKTFGRWASSVSHATLTLNIVAVPHQPPEATLMYELVLFLLHQQQTQEERIVCNQPVSI